MSLCGGSWKEGEGFSELLASEHTACDDLADPTIVLRGESFLMREVPLYLTCPVFLYGHSWKEGEGFSELLASELLASECTPPPRGIFSSLLSCFGAGL